MLTLNPNPANILTDWSMEGAFFTDIRYERPNWVLRAQGWSDLASVPPDYTGPVIYGSRGPERPIMIPLKIVFEGVKNIIYSRVIETANQDVLCEHLDPDLQANGVDLLSQKMRSIGLPLPNSVHMRVSRHQKLRYEEFIAEVEAAGSSIINAHNCLPGQFHVAFEGDYELQVRVLYETATVYLGADIG